MDARPLRRAIRLTSALVFALMAAACGSSSINVAAPTAPKCQVSATNSLTSAPASGGTGSVQVTTTRDCTWSASTAASWITLTSATTGQGSGTVDFRVAANADRSARHGVLAVNDAQLGIDQAPAPCTFAVSPANSAVNASGGAVTVQVTAGAGCAWTTSSGTDWLTVKGSGTASGQATITAAPNAGAARTGSVTVAGETVTIAQADGTAACTLSLSSTSQSIGAAGGAVAIGVTTAGGCQWSAVSSAPWATIVSGASGNGSGQITANVAANATGSDRQATIAIGSSIFTIFQSAAAVPPPPPPPAPCNYVVAPQSYSAAASGATTTVTVTAGASCSWTATSNASWITVTSGGSGTASGVVAIRVAANTGGQRSGTLTIAGQTFTVSQVNASCAFSISPTSSSMQAGGGTGSVAVTVTAGVNCGWTASSTASWITLTGDTSGTGNGNVAFSVAANTGAARTSTISVAGQTFTVSQAANPCSFTIAPSSQSVPSGGTTASVTVTADSACSWTSTSNAPWITIASGGSGSGNGTVSLSIAANVGASRTGTATIAGQTFTVTQDAAPPPCNPTIAPTSQSIPSGGGSPSVAVTAGATCTWTATSNVPWITVTSGASGTGNGAVVLAIAANTGAARTGTVTIATQTYTVAQDAAPPCSFTIAPGSQSVPFGGGTASVAVTAGAGCAWTSTSNAPWITISSGASGTGNGTVALSIAANTGAARTGTVTIAAQTFTVTQDAAPAACNYAIAPTSQSVPSGGGNPSVTVTADASCSWTATSNAPWITVASGASGIGNGSVGLSVAANTGAARTGTVTIANQTFSVAQDAAPCSFSIAPTSQSFDINANTGTVTVTTTAACAWTAASNNPDWITVTSGATGTGSGTVTFSVSANTGLARSGSLTIAGQPFQVNQAGQ